MPVLVMRFPLFVVSCIYSTDEGCAFPLPAGHGGCLGYRLVH